MRDSLFDLLLIQSLGLDSLIESYRVFFLALIPSVFIIACLVEYFDRMDVAALLRRGLISVVILSGVTSFYKVSIESSIEAADSVLKSQKHSNILLLDFFETKSLLHNQGNDSFSDFYKESGYLSGSINFLKKHLFTNFINDGFTTVVYFISQLCIQMIKVVYSLVYYMGFGLIGIPCLIYLFPSMGNVMRGALLSYIWCLIVPHILVFVLSMIGSEIAAGYTQGQIIGGSLSGTVLLFIMTLLIAFTPLIGMMIVNGSGMAQAGGIIASIGANYVMNLPKQTVNNGAMLLSGQNVGPKMSLFKASSSKGRRAIRNVIGRTTPFKSKAKNNDVEKAITSGLSSSNSYSNSKSVKQAPVNSNKSISHKGVHGAYRASNSSQTSRSENQRVSFSSIAKTNTNNHAKSLRSEISGKNSSFKTKNIGRKYGQSNRKITK